MRGIEKLKNKDIIEKRKSLGLTIKELSDALGYGLDGEKQIRGWEKGDDIPDG